MRRYVRIGVVAVVALLGGLVSLAPGVQADGHIVDLLFVAGDTRLPAGDRALVAHLEAEGFGIDVVADVDATPDAVAASDADVVIISSSVLPTEVDPALAGVELPMLVLEGYVFDDLGLASLSGETGPRTTIRLGNSGHPLEAGLSFLPSVLSSPSNMNFGIPGGEAIVVAHEPTAPRRPVLFAYDIDAELADGSDAVARRVAFPFPVYDEFDALNGAGRALLHASLDWLFNEPIPLQILAINDLHGNINSSFSSFGGTGGTQYLTTHLRRLEAEQPNTLIVSAGDLIGASPLISALFHDEPTIEVANLFGLDMNAVGNHEFDEGAAELLRMQNGGPHPVDGDIDGDPFEGADFPFLAANVVVEETGDTLFPGVSIQDIGGVQVGFIGMTLEDTPSIVTPTGVQGLDFRDEADTANLAAAQLQSKGVEAIVVLIHEGGFAGGFINDCDGISGPIVDIVERTTSAVDLFVTGHTHRAYNCVIDGRPVTSSSSFGRVFADIDGWLDPQTGDLRITSVVNELNTPDVEAAADVQAVIDKYDALTAPLANRVIGEISADITRTTNDAGESALGDVIADAQLAATADAGFGDADVAFMNPGGIRADLTFAASGTESDGEVTYSESFTVQPFGNSLVTMTLSGEQLHTLLELQWLGQPFPRILQPSAGFAYTWDAARPDGDKVDPASITIGGVAIDPAGAYRVTVNSFLAAGGDNFPVLADGTDRLGGDLDLDALEAYFVAQGTVDPGPQDRISRRN